MIIFNKQIQNIIYLISVFICNIINLALVNTTLNQIICNILLITSTILTIFVAYNTLKCSRQFSVFNFLVLKYFTVNQSLLDFLKQQNFKANNLINSQKKYIKYNDRNNDDSVQIAVINNSFAKQLNYNIQYFKNIIDSNHDLTPKIRAKHINNLTKISHLNSNFMNIFKKISLGNIEVNVDFQKLLQENINLFQNKKSNIKNISFNIDCAPIQIDLNKKLINIVLKNIIDNAYKFSNNNSNVSIKAEIQNGDSSEEFSQPILHCEICNEGVYIDSQYHKKIFEPFFKKYNNTQFPGNGLGLTICQEIIKLHNGKIWVGEHYAKTGTCIHFTLPLKQNQETENSLIHKKNQQTKDSFNLLVIDDELSCYTSVELILKGSIFKTYHAINGETGLKLLNQDTSKFDIILLDLMMPGISGIEVLKIIKSNILLENIPIIVHSGTSDETLIQNVMQFNGVSFLRKPYGKNKLLFMLNSII